MSDDNVFVSIYSGSEIDNRLAKTDGNDSVDSGASDQLATSKAVNLVYRQLVSILTDVGITPDPADANQVLAALEAKFASSDSVVSDSSSQLATSQAVNLTYRQLATIIRNVGMTPDPGEQDQVLNALKKRFVDQDDDGNVAITGNLSIGGKYISPHAGFKNKIINGNFGINQRGVSGTVVLSADQYGHDRFKAGSAGCTYALLTAENVTTITITAGSLIQIIEGVNLQSGTYTLSWTGTAKGKIGAGSYGVSGITGAIVGGADTNIEFNTGTLSKVQLERGSVATPFEDRLIGTELMLCQRYFEVGNISTTPQGDTSNASVMSLTNRTYKVEKRSMPTVINTTWSHVNSGDTATGTLSPLTTREFAYKVVLSGYTAGWFYHADWTADAEL